MRWPLLWVLAGCEPCPTYGPGTAEEAWQEHVAEIEGEFALSGECPSEPPEEVVTSWGCGYEPEVTVFEEGSRYVRARANTETTGFSLHLSVIQGAKDFGCDDNSFEQLNDARYEGRQMSAWAQESVANPPAFLSSADGASVTFMEEAVQFRSSYSWICLAHSPGPAGDQAQAPSDAWQGAAFVHGDATGDTPTVDAFVAFGYIDCVDGGEDEGAGSDYYGTWDEHCDGIDNDFDGQVDEGAVDSDSDGIADCNE